MADIFVFDTRKAELLLRLLDKTGINISEIFNDIGGDVQLIYSDVFFVKIIKNLRQYYGPKKADQYVQKCYQNKKTAEYIQSKVDIIKSLAKEFGYDIL